MNRGKLIFLARLSARLSRLADEFDACRSEMTAYGFDYPMQPIDPANCSQEMRAIAADIDAKITAEEATEDMADLPF